MTRICWLIGHRYIYKAFTGEYGLQKERNPITGEWRRPEFLRFVTTEFCVRCGLPKPQA